MRTNKISLDFDENLYVSRKCSKEPKKLARMTLAHKKGIFFGKSIQISRLPYSVDSRSVDLVWSCLSEIDQYRIMQELFSAWETHENKEEMRSFLQLSVYLSHNNGLMYFLKVSFTIIK